MKSKVLLPVTFTLCLSVLANDPCGDIAANSIPGQISEQILKTILLTEEQQDSLSGLHEMYRDEIEAGLARLKGIQQTFVATLLYAAEDGEITAAEKSNLDGIYRMLRTERRGIREQAEDAVHDALDLLTKEQRTSMARLRPLVTVPGATRVALEAVEEAAVALRQDFVENDSIRVDQFLQFQRVVLDLLEAVYMPQAFRDHIDFFLSLPGDDIHAFVNAMSLYGSSWPRDLLIIITGLRFTEHVLIGYLAGTPHRFSWMDEWIAEGIAGHMLIFPIINCGLRHNPNSLQHSTVRPEHRSKQKRVKNILFQRPRPVTGKRLTQ